MRLCELLFPGLLSDNRVILIGKGLGSSCTPTVDAGRAMIVHRQSFCVPCSQAKFSFDTEDTGPAYTQMQNQQRAPGPPSLRYKGTCKITPDEKVHHTVIPEKNDPGVGWGWGGGGSNRCAHFATRTFSRASRGHILTRLAGLALLVSLVAARNAP